MAGVRIIVDDDAIMERIRAMVARCEDLGLAMLEIGEVMLISTKERFATETDPSGRPWADNTEVTLARKSNPKILTESGILGDTIRYQVASGGESVSVGTGQPYGAMMQFGGTRDDWPHLWGEIPARPFLGISTDDRAQILEILSDYLTDSA